MSGTRRMMAEGPGWEGLMERVLGLVRRRIGVSAAIVLLTLERRKRVSMTGLSWELGVTLAAASDVVGNLVRRKLVERSRDPEDRRVVWMTLTEKGRGVVAEVMGENEGKTSNAKHETSKGE